MAGQPTKLTPELQAKIVATIAAGNYASTAAQAAGIHRDTFNEWMRRGKEGDPEYSGFSDAVKEARAKAEAKLVAIIECAATNSWQAAAWMLERMFGDRYLRRLAPEDRAKIESVNEQWAKMWAKPDRRGRKGT